MTAEGLTPTDVYNASAEQIAGLAEVVTATNLAALPPSGFTIPVPTDTIVLCARLSNRGTASTDGSSVPSQPLYVFYWQPPANVLVRVDSNAVGGGCYNGTIFSGLMSADGTSGFTLPQGLTAGQTCLIENLDEQDLADALAGGRWECVCRGSVVRAERRNHWSSTAADHPGPAGRVSRG